MAPPVLIGCQAVKENGLCLWQGQCVEERIVELLLSEELGDAKCSMLLPTPGRTYLCVPLLEQIAFYVFSPQPWKIIIPADCIFTSTNDLLTITDVEGGRELASRVTCKEWAISWLEPENRKKQGLF